MRSWHRVIRHWGGVVLTWPRAVVSRPWAVVSWRRAAATSPRSVGEMPRVLLKRRRAVGGRTSAARQTPAADGKSARVVRSSSSPSLSPGSAAAGRPPPRAHPADPRASRSAGRSGRSPPVGGGRAPTRPRAARPPSEMAPWRAPASTVRFMRRSGLALTTGFVLLALVSGLPGLLGSGCSTANEHSASRPSERTDGHRTDSATPCCAVSSLAAAGDDCRCWSAAPASPARGERSPASPTPDRHAASPAPAIAAAPTHPPFMAISADAGLRRRPPVALFTLHAALLI